MANRAAATNAGLFRAGAAAGLTITEIESALQDVFYWEDVRNGQYLDIEDQEGQYRCADGVDADGQQVDSSGDHDGAPLLLVQARG